MEIDPDPAPARDKYNRREWGCNECDVKVAWFNDEFINSHYARFHGGDQGGEGRGVQGGGAQGHHGGGGVQGGGAQGHRAAEAVGPRGSTAAGPRTTRAATMAATRAAGPRVTADAPRAEGWGATGGAGCSYTIPRGEWGWSKHVQEGQF